MNEGDPFFRILCVDDDPSLLQMLCIGFGRHGFEVITASHGIDALMQFQANGGNFGTIISDMHMPVMDGIAFVRQVRAMGYEGRILVISGRMSAFDAHAYQDTL